MRKSNSNSRHQQNKNYNSGANDNRNRIYAKNKTISTIIHTQSQQQQQTTKKNSLNKVSSCAKIANSGCKSSKASLLKIQTKNRASSNINSASTDQTLIKRNQQLLIQNKKLRQQYCKLQQVNLKDKAKIQLLIGRVSQVKSQQANQNATKEKQKSILETTCNNKLCGEKRKILQLQLHRERIKVFQLEQDKKKWDKSRQNLKNQYSQLLSQIQQLRQKA